MGKESRKERLDRIYEDVEMVTSMLHQEGKSVGECSHIEVMAALLLHILNTLGAIKDLLVVTAFALSALFTLLAFRL